MRPGAALSCFRDSIISPRTGTTTLPVSRFGCSLRLGHLQESSLPPSPSSLFPNAASRLRWPRCSAGGPGLRRDECRQRARHKDNTGYLCSVSWPATSPDRPLLCTSCRCFRVKVQTLGCLISTCQVRVQSRPPPPLLPPRAVDVARRRCRSRAHHHRATLKTKHRSARTPRGIHAGILALVDANHGAQSEGKVTTACSLRSRHGREPDTGQYRGDSNVAFTAGPPPCLHGRVRRTPGKRTIEPGKSIIAWCTMLPQEY
ncbi:hypothetical protein B0T18DRAFT_228794 [Schizothecium vesticola]|uniref:Uncharacterized protein n=1 Tax=Schizothecium vesticola TaxID=314040 RepID=A0AA40K0C7_9PEZI|nr:hypothetical protein B0T18DRAFT_228794 [Schizothecium vesticola]